MVEQEAVPAHPGALGEGAPVQVVEGGDRVAHRQPGAHDQPEQLVKQLQVWLALSKEPLVCMDDKYHPEEKGEEGDNHEDQVGCESRLDKDSTGYASVV